MIQKKDKRYLFPESTVNIDRFFLFLGITALGLLISIIFLPSLFVAYDTTRIQALIFVVLSVFLIIGTWFFFWLLGKGISYVSDTKFHRKFESLTNFYRSNQNKLISSLLLIILTSQFLSATFIINQINQGPYSVILNSPGSPKNLDRLGYAYSFDQDAIALHWFKEYSSGNASIFSDDYGTQKITSMINQKSTLYQRSVLAFREKDLQEGYIFLTVLNENYASFFTFNGEKIKISSLNSLLNQKNKIFTNGAVLYQ